MSDHDYLLNKLGKGRHPGNRRLQETIATRLDDEDCESARAMLLALLSDEGGEQLAKTVLSIVISIGQEAATPSSTISLNDQDQKTLKAAKESFQRQRGQCKRIRLNTPETTTEGVAGSQSGATMGKAFCGAVEDDKSKSMHSSQSVLSSKTEQDMPNIKIVCKLKMGAKKDREYTGSTMYDKPHGMGFMIYDYVSTERDRNYTGSTMHGEPQSTILCGNWLHGVFQGQGCAIYQNGDKCFGSFSKYKMHGYATYKTRFTEYVGPYDMDKRHGRGVFKDRDRGTYDGDFVEGRFEGPGVHTSIDGKVSRGVFENWEIKKASSSDVDGKAESVE